MADEAETAADALETPAAEAAETPAEGDGVEGDAEGVDGAEGAAEAAGEAGEGAEGEGEAKPEAEEGPPAPKSAKKNPYQRRIDQLRFEAEQARRERDTALALVGKPPGAEGEAPKTYTEADVDRLANEKAEALAAQKVQTATFNQACNATFEKGKAAHPDFEAARDNLVGVFGEQITPDFLEIITELPNGHDVFHHLGTDLEAAQDVFELKPAKMALRLAAISAEIAKPKGAHVPNLPKPVTPIRGAPVRELDLHDPKIPIDEYVRRRDKQEQLRRQQH